MPDVGGRFRRAEQIALHFRAAERTKQFQLLLRLDALRGRRHVAFGGDVHHCPHDAGRSVRLGDVVDEAAVDLDLVERKTLQIAERGIAGAEIVERDSDADAAKLMQNGKRCFVVANEHGLRDLQFEPARRQAGRRQCRDDLQGQRAAAKLHRRDVDREVDVVGPCRGLRAGRRQHPFAELVDQAGLFRDRNEFGGRDHAAFGVTPAHQRFAAGDGVVGEADAGLVIDLQRLVGDGLAQIQFQLAALLDQRIHVGLEEAIGAAARRFGGIHRQIRVLEDLVEIDAMLGSQRDADAGVRGQLMTETFKRLPDRIENPLDEIGDVGGGFDRGLDDGEFVAAEPGHKVGSRNASAQACGDRLQQFVADQVAEQVVDALEFVDVDVMHRQLLAWDEVSEFHLQPFVEQRAVRQVGQRIVMCKVGDALFGAGALGDILVGRDPAAVGQRFVDDLDRAPVGRLDGHGLSSPMSRSTREQYRSTSPTKDPVALRCAMTSRKVAPGLTAFADRPYISM